MHLEQFDEKHYFYLAKIGRHSEKSWRKRDHVCAAQNYLFLDNLRK